MDDKNKRYLQRCVADLFLLSFNIDVARVNGVVQTMTTNELKAFKKALEEKLIESEDNNG